MVRWGRTTHNFPALRWATVNSAQPPARRSSPTCSTKTTPRAWYRQTPKYCPTIAHQQGRLRGTVTPMQEQLAFHASPMEGQAIVRVDVYFSPLSLVIGKATLW